MPLRVAAIDFLNPAPLMWDFYHPPLADILRTRCDVHLTKPAQCAAQLLAGQADLGLIPIAALTPELAVVPGCTIASLRTVRSIQLVVKGGHPLEEVRTVAADTASRSSVAYAQVLFQHYLGTSPQFLPAEADLPAMLATHDAALLIGDPALLALERRIQIEAAVGPCHWHDVAEWWNDRTGLPWVAAVWAARPASLPDRSARQQLIEDLTASRNHGSAHIEELVAEWTPRIPLSPEVIRHYLTRNIHYHLDDACLEAIALFRKLAAEHSILPPLETLPLL